MRRKFLDIAAGILFCVLQLCACGKEADVSIEEYKLGDVYRSAAGPMSEQEIPTWKEETEQNASAGVYQENPFLFGGGIAQLMVTSDGQAYYQIFSFDSKQWTKVAVRPADMPDSHIGEVFATTSGELCCLVYSGENAALTSLSVGGVGQKLSEQNLLGSLQGGIEQDEHIVVGKGGELFVYLNSEYSVYTSDLKTNTAKVTRLSGAEETDSAEIDGWIHGAVQENGSTGLLFYGVDRDNLPAMWRESGARYQIAFPKDIAATEYFSVDTGDGQLALMDRYGLWEVSDGGTEKLITFAESGYRFENIWGLEKGADNTLLILAEMDGKLLLLSYDLSKKGMTNERQELVLALSMQNVALSNVIAEFNRHSSEYYVSVMTPEPGESGDSFLTRIQMEVTAGRGPDLLEQDVIFNVQSMKDKGYLQCLDGQGFEESGCLATALETGKIDGGLYGIPYEFSLDFAAYRSQEFGKADSVNIGELMKAVRRSDAKVLDPYSSAMDIVLRYAMRDESNTEYIDWEKGKSHLTGKAFLELLAFADEYAARGSADSWSREEVFASHPFNGEFTFYTFQDLQDELGDNVILGYPREKGRGVYMITNKIYLNSQTNGADGCIGFLKYLVSKEAQAQYVAYDIGGDAIRKRDSAGFFMNHSTWFSINRTVMELMVEMEDGNHPDNKFVTDSGQVIYLKPPLTDEQIAVFGDMIENALPAQYSVTPLEEIFREELAPYFEGQCSAETAAEKLNNRVQLYLDER